MNSLDPMQLFGAVDVVVIMAIAVLAYQLEASKKVGDGWATLVPMGLGMVWGIAAGFIPPADGGSAPMPLIVCIVKGVLVNGGAASLAARLAKAGIERLSGSAPLPPKV